MHGLGPKINNLYWFIGNNKRNRKIQDNIYSPGSTYAEVLIQLNHISCKISSQGYRKINSSGTFPGRLLDAPLHFEKLFKRKWMETPNKILNHQTR